MIPIRLCLDPLIFVGGAKYLHIKVAFFLTEASISLPD
jgi:hypothetical protein